MFEKLKLAWNLLVHRDEVLERTYESYKKMWAEKLDVDLEDIEGDE